MDARDALAELVRLSNQVVEAVIVIDGTVAASIADEPRTARLADAGAVLLEAAATVRPDAVVERVSVALDGGALAVVVTGDRRIVATTVPEPALALLVYDLRTALSRIDQPAQRRSRAPRKKAAGT